MSLSEAAASDDRRLALVALRSLIAATIEVAEPQYVAALAKQLRDVLAELDQLRVPEVSAVDQLKAKRAARVGAPKVSDRASLSK